MTQPPPSPALSSQALLTPFDTLFFRDGRAFNLDEGEGAVSPSLFPPSPATVMGALRAWAACSLGWNGRGGWSAEVIERLGNGTDWTRVEPGCLRLTGPVVVWRGCPLWPAPLTLLEPKKEKNQSNEEKAAPLLRLIPGPPHMTDIGMVRLPQVLGDAGAAEGAKPVERCYLAPADFADALAGKAISNAALVSADHLWQQESRIGIARDPDRRTVEEGMLFTTPHVRPRDGLSLAVTLDGVSDAELREGALSLGGEARMVALSRQQGLTDLPPAPALGPRPGGQGIKATVTLVTPMDSGDEGWPAVGQRLGDLPGIIVSACVGKAIKLGGWDSHHRRSLPLRPLLPAGSTWFLDIPDQAAADALHRRHGTAIGRATAWGFGRIAIGLWPQEKQA